MKKVILTGLLASLSACSTAPERSSSPAASAQAVSTPRDLGDITSETAWRGTPPTGPARPWADVNNNGGGATGTIACSTDNQGNAIDCI